MKMLNINICGLMQCRKIIVGVVLLFGCLVRSEVKVTNISANPRWPWNELVDITYSIVCDEKDENGKPVDIYMTFTGYDVVLDKKIPLNNLAGNGVTAPVKSGGPYTVIWDAANDYPTINTIDFKIIIQAFTSLYMVVDLSGGPDASHYPVRYTSNAPNLDDDKCRTTELWLRWIPAGTFIMGSPQNEEGRLENEKQHQVTLSDNYFIAIFECTQKQYSLVMGRNPSAYKGDTRPVEYVSYNNIRGASSTGGGGWPVYGHAVDSSSFMGKLQAKTGLVFDLPTEAEWEYACRAGTTTPYNSGGIGRYIDNKNDGKGGYSEHTKVGSYPPNNWGLYDMHGNIGEWCLDWASDYDTSITINPNGPESPTYNLRIQRGGYYRCDAKSCRSAFRGWHSPQDSTDFHGIIGFRIACHSK